MSYASVAAQGAPSPVEQPRPDPALLNTSPPSADTVVDDTAKVNVVPSDFKSNPVTVTSTTPIYPERDEAQSPSKRSHKSKSEKRGGTNSSPSVSQINQWVDKIHDLVFRPGVIGGLLGIVNVGLLATAVYSFYTSPHLRRDRKVLSSTIAAAAAILGLEDYAVQKYRETPRGQEEERKAKEKGTLIYHHMKEQILRPGVLGGLVGLVNTAVLGVIGYYSYANWRVPTWDRRVVAAVSTGLVGLWGLEGVIASQYQSRK